MRRRGPGSTTPWSLPGLAPDPASSSPGDLVTLLLGIEKEGDQIGPRRHERQLLHGAGHRHVEQAGAAVRCRRGSRPAPRPRRRRTRGPSPARDRTSARRGRRARGRGRPPGGRRRRARRRRRRADRAGRPRRSGGGGASRRRRPRPRWLARSCSSVVTHCGARPSTRTLRLAVASTPVSGSSRLATARIGPGTRYPIVSSATSPAAGRPAVTAANTSSQRSWPAGVVDWATSPTRVSDGGSWAPPRADRLRRPITRRATAEWSCASSTTTWPYVSGGPLRIELASSTSSWSAAVHRRRLPRPSPSRRSTSSRSTSRDRLLRRPGRVERLAQRSGLGPHAVVPGAPQQLLTGDGPQALASLVDGITASVARCQPLGDLVAPEAQAAGTDRHDHVVVGRTDRRERGGRDARRASRGSPLTRATPGVVEPADVDLGDAEVGHRALAHAALTERRQHVGDVVEERPVRPDHEHAVAGRAGGGARTSGRRRGAGRPPSCRCPARPARSAPGRSARG